MKHRFFGVAAGLFVLLSIHFLALAQESCPALVEQALQAVSDSCADLGRNQVCYGNNKLAATWGQNPPSSFGLPGDRAGISDLVSLATAALNVEENIWGVAVMALQANLSDTIPGQNVTFIVFGDSELTSEVGEGENADEFAAPMQAFRLSTGIGNPACKEAPRDGLLVQSPSGTTVNFRVNGVEVEVGSTAFMTAETETQIEVSTFDGSAKVSSGGESQTIEPGFWTLTLEDEAPAEPRPYKYEKMQGLPVDLLPEKIEIPPGGGTVTVPGDSDWVDSGVAVTQGQTFQITASGEVNPCVNLGRTDCVPYGPDGMSHLGTVSQADPQNAASYPLPGATIAALVGRVGEDGAPFLVGAGGTFTADGDGTLQFRINDEPLSNNEGEYEVMILLSPPED